MTGAVPTGSPAAPTPSPGAGAGAGAGRSAAAFVMLAMVQRGAGVLLLPFVTAVMPPAIYGAASTVTATALLLGVVFGSALEVAVSRWAARAQDDSPVVLHLGQLYLYYGLPLLGVVLSGALWLLHGAALGISTRIWALEAIASSLTPAAAFFALPILRVRRQLGRVAALSLTTVVSLVGTKILLLSLMDDKLLAWVLSDLVSGLVTYVVARSLVSVPRADVDRTDVSRLVRFSVPLLPHRVSFWALSSLSRPTLLVVGASLAVIGQYALALNIALVATMVLQEINRAVLPEFSREVFPAPTATTSTVARAQVVAAFLIPAVAGAGAAVCSSFVIDVAYYPALAGVGLLLLGQIAYGIYLVPMNYLVQTAGRTSYSWMASVSGAVAIFVGVILVAGAQSILLISAVTAAGYAVMTVVTLIIVRVTALPIRWSDIVDLRPVLPAAGSAALGVWALLLPVGSTASYGSAASAIVLTVLTALVFWRSRRSRPFTTPHDAADHPTTSSSPGGAVCPPSP